MTFHVSPQGFISLSLTHTPIAIHALKQKPSVERNPLAFMYYLLNNNRPRPRISGYKNFTYMTRTH